MISEPSGQQRIRAILDFLKEVDALKSVYRAAYVGDGTRHENDAEHVWHACLFGLLLHEELGIEANLCRSLELLLVHDLVEVYAGDAPLHDEQARATKGVKEKQAADKLFTLLPEPHATKLRSWWEEYEAAATAEARFANELDRVQAIAQNVISGGRTWDDWKVSEAQARERNARAMGFEPQLGEVFELLFQEGRERGLFH